MAITPRTFDKPSWLGASNNYYNINPDTGLPEIVFKTPLEQDFSGVDPWDQGARAALPQEYNYFFESDIPKELRNYGSSQEANKPYQILSQPMDQQQAGQIAMIIASLATGGAAAAGAGAMGGAAGAGGATAWNLGNAAVKSAASADAGKNFNEAGFLTNLGKSYLTSGADTNTTGNTNMFDMDAEWGSITPDMANTGNSMDLGNVVDSGFNTQYPQQMDSGQFDASNFLTSLQNTPTDTLTGGSGEFTQWIQGMGLGDILKSIGGNKNATSLIALLHNMYQQNKNSNRTYQNQQTTLQRGDPFGAQRPYYQGLYKSMSNGTYDWGNDPFLANALKETNAKMSAGGYNMSGNQLHELMNSSAGAMQNRMNAVGTAAGVNIAPSGALPGAMLGFNQAGNAGADAMGQLGGWGSQTIADIIKDLNKNPSGTPPINPAPSGSDTRWEML